MRPHNILLSAAMGALVACGNAHAPAGHPDGSRAGGTDLARVRRATESYRTIEGAAAAGYAATVTNCIAHPDHGAMGFHHTNAALMDDQLEVDRPEILVYERMADGTYALNGVEYIVPYSVRPPTAEPPVILGRALKRADRLQLWYLHVWLWKENPGGMFADWHPGVECRS